MQTVDATAKQKAHLNHPGALIKSPVINSQQTFQLLILSFTIMLILNSLYRCNTFNALNIFYADMELKRCGMPTPRKLGAPLKLYLLDARQNGRPLEGARLDLVEKFANTYEHARHDPSVSKICQ